MPLTDRLHIAYTDLGLEMKSPKTLAITVRSEGFEPPTF